MAEPLFSASWYRVAQLRPRLAPQLNTARQPVRDQIWHVLVEPNSGRQMRLNPSAWAFAGRCDGNHTVAALWALLLERMGHDAPTQDDIVRLLAGLYRGGMLQFDAAPHLSMLFAQRDRQEQKGGRGWVNPLLLMRMRLFDPTRLLDRLVPLVRPLLGPTALVLWALGVALAALACAVSWPQLRAEAATLAGTPRMLWLAWLAYPVIKAVHELGHAVAVRRFGGAVHELGITLLFFTPAPYVDASAANAFERRGQRMLVSAAGIMVELALAALAAGVWFAVQPGLVRDAAFVTLLICSVSTLLFNGNPLLRLDGYYVFSDALDLPNLAARSNAWWAAWAHRLVRGRAAVPHIPLAAGEAKWLVVYAPLAWSYRLALLLALVGWVGGQSWLLGWLAATLLVGWLAVQAAAALLRLLQGTARPLAVAALVAAAAGTGLLLFLLPVPQTVVARGVVWPPERSQLRAEMAGFVEGQPLADGAPVHAGQLLLTLADPVLQAEHDRRVSELAGLQAQQYQALLSEPARAADVALELARAQAGIERAQQQLSQLEVRARVPGRLVLAKPQDLAGSFAARGALLGYVLEEGPGSAPANVRVVLDEQDVPLVRERVQAVQVRLADAPRQVLAATLQREVPGATRSLPTAALGDRGGGPFAVDPADKEGLRTLAPVFLMDVALPGHPVGRIGARAWVRFELAAEPLGRQWLRRARQLLLRQFNPVGQA